jgi:outer membrane protein OmpA-like peptidoglycan-associated protein
MLNHGDNLYNSNHIQYSASLMYRFINNDDDNDGVKNSNDDCPNVAGVASNNGCPEEINDRDGDGVVDAIDNCPDIYGDSVGCPKTVLEADSDGDSVMDSVDNCPKIKGLPTNNGCPLPDSDNDGIVDSADKCPTVPGIESNNGCPYEEIVIGTTETPINTMMKPILFNNGNANFKQDSYPILIKITKMMKQYPEAKFKVEGHTDAVGSYEFNKRLSQTRANAVRNYLINSGIPSENLVAEGFGETKPTASNLTKEGRRLNRRVEVIRIK